MISIEAKKTGCLPIFKKAFQGFFKRFFKGRFLFHRAFSSFSKIILTDF